MVRTKNLRNDVLFRRFLNGDDAPLRNKTGSLQTRTAPDGTVLLEGYGHNLYAEFRPDDETPIIYTGPREWAKEQYPPNKRGWPQTAQHITNLINEAKELDVEYRLREENFHTAGIPTPPGDLAAIGRLGGYSGTA